MLLSISCLDFSFLCINKTRFSKHQDKDTLAYSPSPFVCFGTQIFNVIL